MNEQVTHETQAMLIGMLAGLTVQHVNEVLDIDVFEVELEHHDNGIYKPGFVVVGRNTGVRLRVSVAVEDPGVQPAALFPSEAS